MIPFGFGVQKAAATAARYTEIAFSVFDQGYLLVLLVVSYLSLSTSAGTDKDTANLGVAQLLLGPYGGRGGGG